MLLAASLVASVNICLADKGRDPPDPPAVPTIVDTERSKALTENNRLFVPPEEKPDECPAGDNRS